ncbi:MAG: 3'(2'),5'-bisphosphate nucleotidase CysQ [Myxococcales bacterium]|nr:3'(2'),5'-bisphosphate nucleotidase CysQ [Myxococcales bacterium]
MSLARELEVATDLARQAGALLLRYFRSDIDVDRKAHGEPVTEADRGSDALITRGLRDAFPDDGVLSEEADEHDSWSRARRAWLVDPMDGTKDFVGGREGFSVMIGLLEGGRPILGVVYQPTTGLCYRAARGHGCEVQRDGEPAEPARPSDVSDPARARLVASYSSRSPRIGEIKQRLGTTDELNVGSVGLKVGLVARGVRDLYVNPEGHCRLWDVCAPEAILREAGGCISDLAGNDLSYEPGQLRVRGGIVASANPVLHAEVIAKIAPLFAR